MCWLDTDNGMQTQCISTPFLNAKIFYWCKTHWQWHSSQPLEHRSSTTEGKGTVEDDVVGDWAEGTASVATNPLLKSMFSSPFYPDQFVEIMREAFEKTILRFPNKGRPLPPKEAGWRSCWDSVAEEKRALDGDNETDKEQKKKAMKAETS